MPSCPGASSMPCRNLIVRNLVANNKLVPANVLAFTKLFDMLGLPTQEVNPPTTQPAARQWAGLGR